MTDLNAVDNAIEGKTEQSLDELGRLCAQPSISAQGVGMEACAELVKEMLQARGFEAQILPTGGFPVVFAKRKGLSDRTLLFYNHYDVQPPEPLDLWLTPPFEPAIREGNIYARRVSDDK